jgi:hypothetical protein
MGCIAIVCVLLFWFCYFGILAKWVVHCFWVFGFGAVGSGRVSPSFQPLDSVAFANIIGSFDWNFSSFSGAAAVLQRLSGWRASCYYDRIQTKDAPSFR